MASPISISPLARPFSAAAAYDPAQASGGPTVLPRLFFGYSPFYDAVCSQADCTPILPEAAAEAASRAAELQQLWESPDNGLALFRQLWRDFHRGFKRREMTATLSTCAPTTHASYANPLVINVSHYLRSYMAHQPGNPPVWPGYRFVDSVFHELLHTWVNENLDADSSAMLRKYKNETFRTKAHLHVFAVQRLVYEQLKKNDELKWIDDLYTNSGDADFSRAWAIVKAEGYQPFVDELQKSGAGESGLRQKPLAPDSLDNARSFRRWVTRISR